ncbi:MAG: hypothetical protein ABSH07_07425 [Candidatus Dormibacteria bacterium]|jgi:hypothetical protein
MRALLPVVVLALALLFCAGLAVWVWLPSGWRRLTLPALPLIGAMALAVGLHLTGIVTGVRVGLIVLGAIAVLGLGLRSWREPWWRDLRDRGALRGLGAALVIGAVAFWFLFIPARTVGLDLVAPAGGNDSFAYITPAAWLEDHAITQVPADSGPPVWGYTELQLSNGFRMGEELDQAAVATVTGHDILDTWYTVASLWILILPGGLIAAASALGLSRKVGASAGVLAATSSVVLSEVIFSHSAGALGLAMAPLSVAVAGRYLDDAMAQRPDRPPAWFVAGAITALACTYTEYLPALALAAAVYVLARRPDLLLRSLRAAAVVAGLALLMGPLAWFRVVHSLANETQFGQGAGQPSFFLAIPPPTIVAHYVGTVAIDAPGTGSALGYAALVLLAAGALLAVAISPARRFFAIVIGSIAALVLVLSTVHYFPYGQGELVQVTFSVVMLAVAAGYGALLARLSPPRLGRWPRRAAAGLAAALIVVFAAVNVNTTLPFLTSVPPSAIHDTNGLNAVRNWLLSVAGPTGADAMVLDTQVWDQIWLQYELRDMTDVNFPYVVIQYGNGNPDSTRYFDGQSRRYAVVESDLLMDVSPGVIVGGAGDCSFLDLSRGTAVLAVGTGLSFNPVSTDPVIGTVQWMINDGQLLLFHSRSVTRVVLSLVAPPQLTPISVKVESGSQVLATANVSGAGAEVSVNLPPGNAILLTLVASKAAVVVPPDPRLRSIGITGVLNGS